MWFGNIGNAAYYDASKCIEYRVCGDLGQHITVLKLCRVSRPERLKDCGHAKLLCSQRRMPIGYLLK